MSYQFDDTLTLDKLRDERFLDYYLSSFYISSDSPKYEPLKKILLGILDTPIKISNLEQVFRMVALKSWEKYRDEYKKVYTNNFTKTCILLEHEPSFDDVLDNLPYLREMKRIIGKEKFQDFSSNLSSYYQVFRSKNPNKLELLKGLKDDISLSLAMFVAKSKEDYMKDIVNEFTDSYKGFFKVKTDNMKIRQKITLIKQREKLKEMYSNNDDELALKIATIKEKYISFKDKLGISEEKFNIMLDYFIRGVISSNVSSIEEVIRNVPSRYHEYQMYEKTLKIINRLNAKNIMYDSSETFMYRELIGNNNGKYYYCGNTFNDEELKEINDYKLISYLFGKVRTELIKYALKLDDYGVISEEEVIAMAKNFSFTDDIYSFDSRVIDNCYLKLINNYMTVLTSVDVKRLEDEDFINVFINEGLLPIEIVNSMAKVWFKNKPEASSFDNISIGDITRVSLIELFTYFDDVKLLMNKSNLSIQDIYHLFAFKEVLKKVPLRDLCLLGNDVLQKECLKFALTTSSRQERIQVDCDLASVKYRRDKASVPYIKGSVGNYVYSVYDVVDNDILTSGIDTTSCFRATGTDNDFFHYCILNENGVILKICDIDGNLIARISGFRNGNGIYFNQLRTIYDKVSVPSYYERTAIINAFKAACDDIIRATLLNPNDKTKIEFAVITKSYSMNDVESNIDDETLNYISLNAVSNKGKNWQEFITNTKNLMDCKDGSILVTDYGTVPLICVSSVIGDLSIDKIKTGDVEAVYKRPRSTIVVYDSDEKVEETVNRIRAIESYNKKVKFDYFKIPSDTEVVMGDNWYIIYRGNEIIDSCCLKDDKEALNEFLVSYRGIINGYIDRKEKVKKR